jgi:hypothetical protein
MPSHVRELDARTDATAVLEAGDVVWQPRGFFLIQEREQPLFSPAVLASGKNVSFDPAPRRVGGSSLTGDLSHALWACSRFSDESNAFSGASAMPRLARGCTVLPSTKSPDARRHGVRTTRGRRRRLPGDAYGRRILHGLANLNPWAPIGVSWEAAPSRTTSR